MKNKILTLGSVIVLVVLVVLGAYAYKKSAEVPAPPSSPTDGNTGSSGSQVAQVDSFDECVAAGYAVEESYPRVCRTPDGRSFQENVGNGAAKNDMIQVDNPKPNAIVQTPLKVTGKARGSWFFEASFPVKIYDENGKVLGVGVAEATGDWMTDDFVPFEVTLEYTLPEEGKRGTLILEKDNPSGSKEKEDSLRIPIIFGKTVGMEKVSLYYYNPEKDKDIGGRILCSKQGLVPVEREIVKTKTPITDTIRLLLQGKLTAEEEKAGLETEFPLYRLTLTSTKLENGQLTLNFNDPGDETRGGGACRVNVLRAQVLQTAKQFSGVKQVAIAPDAVFKP